MNCFSKTLIYVLTGLTLCALGNVFSADDHAPAPMMNTTTNNLKTKQENDPFISNRITLDNFRSIYQEANSPTLVLYWNDEFAVDFGKQILAVYRKTSQVESITSLSHEITEIAVFGSNTSASGLGKKLDFELESGFFQLMRHASANLVERDSIVRLIGNASSVEDVVLEALAKYADVIVELQIHEQTDLAAPVSVLVTVTDIKSAHVLSKFSIDGSVSKLKTVSESSWVAGEGGFENIEADTPAQSLLESIETTSAEKEYKWVAGINGYEKVEVEQPGKSVLSPAHALGQLVAIGVMENLSRNGMP